MLPQLPKIPSFPNKLKTLPYVVIFFLLAVIVIDRCQGPAPAPKPKVIVKTDTLWVERKVTVPGKPVVEKSKVTPPKGGSLPAADTNCVRLKKQYEDLRDSFYTLKTYTDTLKIDSLGYVTVKDTVHQNRLQGRTFSYDLRYPKVITTITIREPYLPKRQLYAGIGVSASYPDLKTVSLEGGLLYKDRKDRLYGPFVSTDFNHVFLGARSYWKIRLKK